MRVTAQAHVWLLPVLCPGAKALDGTAGNGWDTLFLAQQIAPGGWLWWVDVQAEALGSTQERVAPWLVQLHGQAILGHHQDFPVLLEKAKVLPQHRLDAAIFNLGYLPGGDPQIVTTSASTLCALDTTFRALRSGGRLAVVAYPGHPGGAEETAAVADWVEAGLEQGVMHRWIHPASAAAPPHAPQGFFVEKRG